MPLLLVYYIANASRRHHINSKVLTILAMLFAWGGDLVLLYEQWANSFVAGLGLFLAMHLVYIIYFWRMHGLFPVKDMARLVMSVAIVGIVDAFVFIKLLPLVKEKDPGLAMPIMVYMAVISFMFVMACNILGSKKAKSLALPFFIPGSALFIVSDTLLGFNMFLWDDDNIIDIGVMFTYGYAQHLIVHGFIKHVRGRI